MKALFQSLMIASMLSIILDITSCTREYVYSNSFPIHGKFIDVNTRQPINHVKLCLHATNGAKDISTESDESGHFEVTILSYEKIDYSISVMDKHYKIVNVNNCINRNAGSQVWYLERVNSK